MASCNSTDLLATAYRNGYAKLSARDLMVAAIASACSTCNAQPLIETAIGLGYLKLSEFDAAMCIAESLCSSPGVTAAPAPTILKLAMQDHLAAMSRRDLDGVVAALLCKMTNPPCVTPTAPSQPVSFGVFDTQIKISWTQPANPGSLILGYTVSYGTTQGGPYTNSFNRPASARSAVISGLSTGTTYYFVVTANSFTGCSSANSAEGSAATTGTPPIDPAAQDWANRTVVNGASVLPSNAVILAVDTFVKALKSAGVWTKLHMINMIAWDTTATIANNRIYIKTPLLVGCGIDPWREINGPIPDAAFTINGFTKPGAQFIDCFDGATSLLSNCIASPNSASIIEYMFSTSNLSGFDWGQQDAAGNGLIINSFFTATGSQAYVANTANPATINQGLLNGYYCGSRTANNRVDLYFANSTHAHASVASDVTVNTKALSTFHTMPLQTLNNNGDTTTFQIGRPQSFAALGDGLTAADSLALFNAIQALRTSFGGGFI